MCSSESMSVQCSRDLRLDDVQGKYSIYTLVIDLFLHTYCKVMNCACKEPSPLSHNLTIGTRLGQIIPE